MEKIKETLSQLYIGGTWPKVRAKEAKAVYEEMHKEKLKPNDSTLKKLMKDLNNAKFKWR